MRENMFSNLFQSINQYIIPTSPDGKSWQNLSGQFFALKNSWWIFSMGQFKFVLTVSEEKGIFVFFPKVIGLRVFGQKGG